MAPFVYAAGVSVNHLQKACCRAISRQGGCNSQWAEPMQHPLPYSISTSPQLSHPQLTSHCLSGKATWDLGVLFLIWVILSEAKHDSHTQEKPFQTVILPCPCCIQPLGVIAVSSWCSHISCSVSEPTSSKAPGRSDTRTPDHKQGTRHYNTRMPSRAAGQRQDAMTFGHQDSVTPGCNDTKTQDAVTTSHQDTMASGHQDTRMPGHCDTRSPGHNDIKRSSHNDTRSQ